ncbi:Major facilitator superfamily domain general substrate transporter [Penicillium atrosanguineum]|uniref:Major facilitator superfamily domain general substrate transporter n=1 Tax=Penicillium atrosanguineum TaxID=1132637 RepID=UPI0023A41E92|nr:Major facilitator superfamily domain general substrate transporter [Penicillium atrosanguineum]KAJ5301216.1 Major facilitator superfamily domain general substrate transporter [Penicillium atrosanguineum]
MAPITLDSKPDPFANGISHPPQPDLIRSSMNLVLFERPRRILNLVEHLNAPPAVQDEPSDIQFQRLLQLTWLVTIRAFLSSTTLYIGESYHQGYSFVGETHGTVGSPTGQLHLDTQVTVLELFQQMIGSLDLVSKEQSSNGVLIKNGKGSEFDCTIIYQTQPVKNQGSDTRFCMGCQACCSTTVKSSELQLSPGGLRLYITKMPDNRFRTQIEPNSNGISMPLATSLLDTFNQALSSIFDKPTNLVGLVDLCSPQDIALITSFTKDLAPAQDVLLHDLCLRHVETTPDAPAVRSWDGDLCYRELNERASRLAHWLVGQGVGPGVFVACTFYKSTWAIVARLAILIAGGAYICVDAHDPPPYLESLLQRTRIQIVLTSVGFGQKFADLVNTTFEVGESSLEQLPSTVGVPCVSVLPTDPCTVLFTSGSTGNPKGIIQEHRSYASALTDYIRVMKMGPHSRLFQFDAYAFDISNNDFLAPLIAGGCCCVPTTSLTMEALMNDLNELEANFMFVTPSVAIDINPDRVPTLKTMCVGGEPVSDAVLAKWLHRVRLVNQYGMGEVASLCAYNPDLRMGRGAVVGRPASGAIWIVNPDAPDQLMPVGAIGELVVEGPHVSRGYLDHLSGISNNYLDEPPAWAKQLHPERPAHRVYRSGDLGRYNHDGTIEVIGRKDSMLKLDGARVEAGQIEYVLRRQLATGDAAVVDLLGVVDGVSDPILAVYLYLTNNPMNLETGPVEDMQFRPITDRHAASVLTQSLTDAIRGVLPPYYVPSLFLLVDRVPRTKSKKTDRRKLHTLGQDYYMAHREELREITVWPEWD